jgi:hypothetical protein
MGETGGLEPLVFLADERWESRAARGEGESPLVSFFFKEGEGSQQPREGCGWRLVSVVSKGEGGGSRVEKIRFFLGFLFLFFFFTIFRLPKFFSPV